MNGKNFVGEAKLLSTPMGEIAKALIKDGGKLGVSSRGMGSLESKVGANYVKDDFYLHTAADIVADPSAPQLSLRVLWKERNGCGIMVFSKKLRLLESKMRLMKV